MIIIMVEDFEVDVIIEIPYGSNVKYELDDNGRIYVDRVLSTSMVYPGNYGFIEKTLAGDGDPTDALIINHVPFAPCSRVSCRIIGVLETRDEKGLDEKIICVPIDKIDKRYGKYGDILDFSQGKLDMISHFFENYKTLEKGKYVQIIGYGNRERAVELVDLAFKTYSEGEL